MVPGGAAHREGPAVERVTLELYEGPLDLLLHLVRRQELDVLDLPLAEVTRQFEEMIAALEVLDVDVAAEFLVVAATLAEIKSQQALPRVTAEADEEPAAEEESVDSDLVARLLQYKRYKDAAQVLAVRGEEWAERFERIGGERAAGRRDVSQDRIRDLELWDLLSAFSRIVRTQLDEEQTTVRDPDVPVHELVEQVGRRIRQEGEVRFFALFEGRRSRGPIVGLFLSVLELVRHHGFRAEQAELFGDIVLRPPITEDADLKPPGDDVEPPSGAGDEGHPTAAPENAVAAPDSAG